MMPIIVTHCGNKDEWTKQTSITWAQTFIELGKDKLFAFYADMLGAIIPSIAHSSDEIRNAAVQTNQMLLDIVNATTETSFEIGPICSTVTKGTACSTGSAAA